MRGFVLPTKVIPAILLFIYLFYGESNAQLSGFDSTRTIASSLTYDYKNPNFEWNEEPYSQGTWLAYERHSGNSSDIIVRKITFSEYSAEILITNTAGELNINPVINRNFIFWQSNRNGNWDMYYSIYNGIVWSSPQIISNTSSDEINPYIFYNRSSPIQYTAYYLIFERAGDIIFRKYRLQTSSWDSLEVNLTDSITDNCSKPVITGSSDCNIYFAREVSPGQKKISARRIREQNNILQLYPTSLYNYILTDNNYCISNSWGNPYFTFSSGSPNNNIIGLRHNSSSSADTFTTRFFGSHTNGKGSLVSIVTDASGSYYFSAFGCVTRSSDSTYISLIDNFYSSWNPPDIKKKYLGNDSVKTKLDLSIPVSSGMNLYKIRAVWEQTINGKTALVESYMIDLIGSVTNTGIGIDYILGQNYPNPFNPSTKINYELRNSNYVTLKVFDLLGKEVAQLVNEKQIAGSYAVDFNSTEFNLPSGVYFYTLNTGGFKETKKMVLVK